MATAAPAGVVEREPALPQTTIDTGHADMIVRLVRWGQRTSGRALCLERS